MAWLIESVRDADVDVDSVFALYADPSTWSAWGHNATWARADGPLTEGGIVHVRANYGRVYPCLITRLIPGRRLDLQAKPPLTTVNQSYEVEPSPTGARIRHAIEVSAPFAGLMKRLGVARTYERLLDKEVGRLIDLASRPGQGIPGA